ncbi:MAG: hypothetical protein LAN62_18370, partial [Acidobacteriia bacterium]|nr:hypothetical protein [Terriglobia bacterium]
RRGDASLGDGFDVALLRSGCEDESAWQQEFCCQFVSTAENFIPPDLLASCLSAEAGLGIRDSGPISGLRWSPSDSVNRRLATREKRNSKIETGNSAVESSEASFEFPVSSFGSRTPDTRLPTPEFFLGIDIGRRHDRTVLWLDEVQPAKFENRNSKLESTPSVFDFRISSFDTSTGNQQSSILNYSIARAVRTMDNVPFAEQLAAARELLSLTVAAGLPHQNDGGITPPRQGDEPLIRRACIDATGIGAPLAEALAREFGPRVEPVVFTAALKEDLAFRTKRRLEARLSLLPDTREVRRAFSAVKKYVTPSGNLRFDAARTDAGHADEFWAKALADLAADSEAHRVAAAAADGFLADAAPIINPWAFREVDLNWSGVGWN